MGYTKLFSDIVMSTVWREPDHVRLVWITMLACKDRHDIVNSSIPGLADAARVTIEQCEKALERLSEPDPYSRSTEYGGRRIEPCDGGWVVLNGEKYRHKLSPEDEAEKARIRKARQRAREKAAKGMSRDVTGSHAPSRQAEAEAEEEKKDISRSRFEEFYEEYPRKRGRGAAEKIWKRRNLDTIADAIISGLKNLRDFDRQWGDKKYIPYPSVFLNGDRWKDEVERFDQLEDRGFV